MVVKTRRTVLVMLLLAAGACGNPAPVVMAPVPPTTVPTTLEAPTDTAAPPESAPPEPAPEAEVADDPVPVGARPAPARSTAAPVTAGPKAPQPTGRIDIPAIGLSHATYEGVELSVLNYGPGHWPGTAMPGERGNTVFPGHRTTYSRPFWDIDKLVVGDRVVFTTPAGRFTYRVDQTLIVDAKDTWIINQTKEATFTIFACHPKGSARQRYVVKGSLVESARPTATTAPPATTTTTEPSLIPGLP